jgi:RecA-family ATPase
LRAPESLEDLVRKQIDRVESWVLPGLVPKSGKMLFGGAAKIGKSLIMLELARALGSGTSPFEWRKFTVERPVRVLLIEQEIGEQGLRLRVERIFGAHPEALRNVYYVSKDPGLVLSEPSGRERLREYVRAARPEVLFLDPISKFHFYDENDPIEIAKLLKFLDELIEENASRGMSVIFSHHFRKGPATDLQRAGYDPLDPYNFGGSRKWFDDPDALITLVRQKSFTNPQGERAWELRARIELRHDEPPPDALLHVNEYSNLRVIYQGPAQDPDESLSSVLRPLPRPTGARSGSGLASLRPGRKEPEPTQTELDL